MLCRLVLRPLIVEASLLLSLTRLSNILPCLSELPNNFAKSDFELEKHNILTQQQMDRCNRKSLTSLFEVH